MYLPPNAFAKITFLECARHPTHPQIDLDGRGQKFIIGTVWDRFVDAVTILWLGMFFANIYQSDLIPTTIEFGLLGVFVVDLVVKARAEPNLSTFLRKRWTDILMVIPYFRIFRILRFTRLLRILRAARIVRVGRFPGVKSLETFRRNVGRVINRFRRNQ